MLLLPKLVQISYLSKLAIAANRLTVKIHTGIVTKYQSWTKLWYFLRGLDRSNSGFGRILLEDICYWLGAAPSTIRQWLREGKKAGAFRFWAERRGIVSIAIGSPTAVVIGLKLYEQSQARSIRRAWGTVSEISIFELDQLRAHATAVEIQHLQSQSHFAATVASAKDRKRLRVPSPEDLFEAADRARASQNPDGRALLPFLCKITASRFWVSKSFRVLGCSQALAAKARGYCDRTIRHHLSLLGIESKQIVQAKADYGRVALAIEQSAQYKSWGEGDNEITLIGNVTGWNHEKDQPILQHKLCEGVEGDFPRGGIDARRSRFFPAMGKWWMYRCNVYRLNYPLHSMELARDKWWAKYVFEILQSEERPKKSEIKLAPISEKILASGLNSHSPYSPPLIGHFGDFKSIFTQDLENVDTTAYYLEEQSARSVFEKVRSTQPG